MARLGGGGGACLSTGFALVPLVASTTGVRVRETIPDWVLKRADEVVNVDVSVETLRTRLRQGKIESWHGPAQSFVYATLRNDAVDVVYGTVAGFARLGVPYMPHILPERSW